MNSHCRLLLLTLLSAATCSGFVPWIRANPGHIIQLSPQISLFTSQQPTRTFTPSFSTIEDGYEGPLGDYVDEFEDLEDEDCVVIYDETVDDLVVDCEGPVEPVDGYVDDYVDDFEGDDDY